MSRPLHSSSFSTRPALSSRGLGRLVGSVAFIGALAACGGKDSPAPVCAVTAVAVSPSTGSIAVGETLNLNAAITQTNCTGLTTNWTSSNPAVATVSSTGAVTGVTAGGPVLITAQAGTGSGSAAIVVTPAAIASIALTLPSPIVNEGQSAQVTAAVSDARGNALTGRALSWSSSNTGIATVDGTGRVTGVSPGGATITARDASNPNVSGTLAITVRAVVQRVQVTAPSPNLVVGQTVALTATITSTSNQPITDRTPTWTSSNVAVATVNATGQVTGVSAGTTTIQATSDGVSGSVGLTVAVPVITSITLAGVPATAPIGVPVGITPQVLDQNGNSVGASLVQWSTSNARVAMVPPTTAYTRCAAQDAQCTFTGTKLVRFGLGNTVTHKEVTGGTACSIAAFGFDPVAGAGGFFCDVADLPQTAGVTNLRPLSAGQVTITVRSVSTPSVSASATFTVTTTGGVVRSWGALCSGSCSTTTPNPLVVGGGINIWAVAFDNAFSPNALEVPATVTSSDPAVLAVVGPAGGRRADITAVGPGTATISFTAGGGVTAPAFNFPFTVTGTAAAVASVSVALNSSSIAVGQTTQATATTRDAANNVLTGRAIAWTSSNTAVATVNATSGLVTAVGVGTATITATSEGKIGAATVNVTAGVSSVRLAYAMVDGNTSTTNADFTFNGTGGAVTVDRFATGAWTVTFAGMAPAAGQSDITRITPKDGANCTVSSSFNLGSERRVSVRCFEAPFSVATPTNNAGFSVMVVGNEVFGARSSFFFAHQPSVAGPYAPPAGFFYTSAGSAIALSRVGTGDYRARTGALRATPSSAEVPLVGYFGSAASSCESQGVDATGNTNGLEEIQCIDPVTGALTDATYNSMIFSRGRPGTAWGFAYFSRNQVFDISPFQAQSTPGTVPFVSTPAPGRQATFSALPTTGPRLLQIMPNFNGAFGTTPPRFTVCGYGALNIAAKTYEVICRDRFGVVVPSDFVIVVAQ